jgi:hypothetical protein
MKPGELLLGVKFLRKLFRAEKDRA